MLLEIKKKVKNLSIIALGGDERALIDDALKLVREVLPENERELNHLRLMVGEDSLDDLFATLNTMPFLAKKRIVELHGAEKLKAEKEMLDYLENPAPFSVLVLVFDKIDRRSKLVSALLNKELLYIFDKEADRIKLIINEAKARSLEIDQAAAQLLNIVTNKELLLIKSAIQKLSLSCQGKITTEDIEKQVVNTSEQDVFMLARLISEGNLSEALLGLERLRSTDEHAIKFLGVLAWQFRVLLHIRHCQEQKISDWDIRKLVGVFGDRYEWMAQVAKKKPVSFHINRLTKLLECDQKLKSVNLKDPFSLVEKVVYQSAIGLGRP